MTEKQQKDICDELLADYMKEEHPIMTCAETAACPMHLAVAAMLFVWVLALTLVVIRQREQLKTLDKQVEVLVTDCIEYD
jgi:hypothetical protein